MDSSSQTRAGRKSVNEERTSPEPVNLTEFATQSCQFICLRAPTQIASNFGRFTDASAGGRQAFLRGQQYNTTFLGRKNAPKRTEIGYNFSLKIFLVVNSNSLTTRLWENDWFLVQG